MGDTLPAGARIRIERGENVRYQSGAIVAFLAGDALIAHRVLRDFTDLRGRRGLVTMGDAATVCDPPISAEIVIGEVRSVLVGDRWAPPGVRPRRAWASRLVGFVTQAGVTACAMVDLRVTSVLLEMLLTAEKRVASALRRGLGASL